MEAVIEDQQVLRLQVPRTPLTNPYPLGNQLLLHFTERSPPPPEKVWQRGGGERHAFQVPPI